MFVGVKGCIMFNFGWQFSGSRSNRPFPKEKTFFFPILNPTLHETPSHFHTLWITLFAVCHKFLAGKKENQRNDTPLNLLINETFNFALSHAKLYRFLRWQVIKSRNWWWSDCTERENSFKSFFSPASKPQQLEKNSLFNPLVSKRSKWSIFFRLPKYDWHAIDDSLNCLSRNTDEIASLLFFFYWNKDKCTHTQNSIFRPIEIWAVGV